jgi:hypothetical protein
MKLIIRKSVLALLVLSAGVVHGQVATTKTATNLRRGLGGCSSSSSSSSSSNDGCDDSPADDRAGLLLEETHRCVEWTNPNIQGSIDRTTDSECAINGCRSEGSCCRYHTAFLTCDTDNTYAHQPCVCNEWTSGNRAGPGLGTIGTGVPRANGHGPQVSTSNRAGNQGMVANPSTGPTCAGNGSAWQTLGLDYQNCAVAADCFGVVKDGEQTCCKRAFCWCGTFDVAAAECI